MDLKQKIFSLAQAASMINRGDEIVVLYSYNGYHHHFLRYKHIKHFKKISKNKWAAVWQYVDKENEKVSDEHMLSVILIALDGCKNFEIIVPDDKKYPINIKHIINAIKLFTHYDIKCVDVYMKKLQELFPDFKK